MLSILQSRDLRGEVGPFFCRGSAEGVAELTMLCVDRRRVRSSRCTRLSEAHNLSSIGSVQQSLGSGGAVDVYTDVLVCCEKYTLEREGSSCVPRIEEIIPDRRYT